MCKASVISWCGMMALILAPYSAAHGAIIFTGTPENSWSYSFFAPAGLGGDPAFTPMQLFSAQTAFQGFVTYTHHPSANFNSADDIVYGLNDSIHVFSTYIKSESSLSLTIRLEGDDGHSLFFDGVLAGGGGFGSVVDRALVLEAGVARKVDVVGYNAGGPWLFAVTGFTGTAFSAIEDIPGITINATGAFDVAPVPEPTSFALWIGASAALMCWTTRRRLAHRKPRSGGSV